MSGDPGEGTTAAETELPAGVISLDGTFPASASIFNLEKNRFWLSVGVTITILVLFMINTACVAWMVTNFAQVDTEMIQAKQIDADHRLITERVILSVIGATFVQVGAAVYVIVQWVFKGQATQSAVNSGETG